MTATRTRLGAAALMLAGLFFILYPALRPWHDESTLTGARASMSSNLWVVSHLFAMLGFIMVPLGLLALYGVLAATRAGRPALAAVVTTWIGAGLTLPYYGAEDFGLHAIARSGTPDLLSLAESVRFDPVAATTFALGLLALGAGAVLAAVTVWRSGVLPRAAGVAFALGFALFIPQFYAPAWVRIAHGVLVAVGCVQLGLALVRAAGRPAPERSEPVSTDVQSTLDQDSRVM